jgi:NAD(P)-dependent dehydrogenase (short-subunit alcohol dehydrogenase family)
VIVVGRRKDKLDDFVKNYGSVSSAKVDAAVFDITDLKSIPKFAIDIVERHPDLDCVFLNSGMQRALNWAEPESLFAFPPEASTQGDRHDLHNLRSGFGPHSTLSKLLQHESGPAPHDSRHAGATP